MLIDQKDFFDIPIKNKEEPYEKLVEISKDNNYITGNLLDYDYYSRYYKVVAVNLSKQTELVENLDLKQQINFIGRLEKDNATMYFIIEKSEEITFDFTQNSVSVV